MDGWRAILPFLLRLPTVVMMVMTAIDTAADLRQAQRTESRRITETSTAAIDQPRQGKAALPETDPGQPRPEGEELEKGRRTEDRVTEGEKEGWRERECREHRDGDGQR